MMCVGGGPNLLGAAPTVPNTLHPAARVEHVGSLPPNDVIARDSTQKALEPSSGSRTLCRLLNPGLTNCLS
jgi:hypothetical protein